MLGDRSCCGEAGSSIEPDLLGEKACRTQAVRTGINSVHRRNLNVQLSSAMRPSPDTLQHIDGRLPRSAYIVRLHASSTRPRRRCKSSRIACRCPRKTGSRDYTATHTASTLQRSPGMISDNRLVRLLPAHSTAWHMFHIPERMRRTRQCIFVLLHSSSFSPLWSSFGENSSESGPSSNWKLFVLITRIPISSGSRAFVARSYDRGHGAHERVWL